MRDRVVDPYPLVVLLRVLVVVNPWIRFGPFTFLLQKTIDTMPSKVQWSRLVLVVTMRVGMFGLYPDPREMFGVIYRSLPSNMVVLDACSYRARPVRSPVTDGGGSTHCGTPFGSSPSYVVPPSVSAVMMTAPTAVAAAPLAPLAPVALMPLAPVASVV